MNLTQQATKRWQDLGAWPSEEAASARWRYLKPNHPLLEFQIVPGSFLQRTVGSKWKLQYRLAPVNQNEAL